MQESQVKYKSSQYRFRRWSRHAWAVFASLRKVISIGNLSLLMIPGTILLERIPSFFNIINDEEKNEDSVDWQDEIILEKEFLLINAKSDNSYGQFVNKMNINRNG
jgi:hypothetical protein